MPVNAERSKPSAAMRASSTCSRGLILPPPESRIGAKSLRQPPRAGSEQEQARDAHQGHQERTDASGSATAIVPQEGAVEVCYPREEGRWPISLHKVAGQRIDQSGAGVTVLREVDQHGARRQALDLLCARVGQHYFLADFGNADFPACRDSGCRAVQCRIKR
jgi:hypothetical protein